MKEVIAIIFNLFYWNNPESPYGLDRVELYWNIISLFKKRIQYFIKKYASNKEYNSDLDFPCPY